MPPPAAVNTGLRSFGASVCSYVPCTSPCYSGRSSVRTSEQCYGLFGCEGMETSVGCICSVNVHTRVHFPHAHLRKNAEHCLGCNAVGHSACSHLSEQRCSLFGCEGTETSACCICKVFGPCLHSKWILRIVWLQRGRA